MEKLNDDLKSEVVHDCREYDQVPPPPYSVLPDNARTKAPHLKSETTVKQFVYLISKPFVEEPLRVRVNQFVRMFKKEFLPEPSKLSPTQIFPFKSPEAFLASVEQLRREGHEKRCYHLDLGLWGPLNGYCFPDGRPVVSTLMQYLGALDANDCLYDCSDYPAPAERKAENEEFWDLEHQADIRVTKETENGLSRTYGWRTSAYYHLPLECWEQAVPPLKLTLTWHIIWLIACIASFVRRVAVG